MRSDLLTGMVFQIAWLNYKVLRQKDMKSKVDMIERNSYGHLLTYITSQFDKWVIFKIIFNIYSYVDYYTRSVVILSGFSDT